MRRPLLGFLDYSPPPSSNNFFVDEALLVEPNLWTPGKKPTGPVEIDWDHPLTRGLRTAVISQNGLAIDLANGLLAQNTGNIALDHSQYGEFLSCTTSSTTSYATFIDGGNGFDTASAAEPISIVTKVINYEILQAGRYFTSQRGPDYIGTWRLTNITVAAGCLFTIYNDSQVTAYSASIRGKDGGYSDWGSNTWWTFGMSTSGLNGDSIDFYHDGFPSDSGTLNGDATMDATASDLSFVGQSRDTNLTAECGVEFLYLWQGKKLSDAEQQSIALDPYQILKPA